MSVKVIIKKDALEGAIKKVAGVYSQMGKKDSALIVMQAVNGKRGDQVFKGLTLTISNGSTQVSTNLFCEMESEIEGNVSFSVGADLINAVNALSGAKGEKYTLTESENVVVVSMGNNNIKIPKKAEGVMPVPFDISIPDTKIEGKICITGKDFRTSVASILFAALADDEKALGGIGCIVDGEKMVFRAMDSVRLAEATISTVKVDAEGAVNFVVSPSVIKLITATAGDGNVAIIKTTKHLLVQVGNDMWQIALLDKNYPHKVFECINATGGIVNINKAELLVALDIISATDNLVESTARLSIEEDESGNTLMVIYSRDEQSRATVAIKKEGDVPLVTCFSTKLLKSCAMAFKGETLNFVLAENAPLIITAEGEGIRVALCPVKNK